MTLCLLSCHLHQHTFLITLSDAFWRLIDKSELDFVKYLLDGSGIDAENSSALREALAGASPATLPASTPDPMARAFRPTEPPPSPSRDASAVPLQARDLPDPTPSTTHAQATTRSQWHGSFEHINALLSLYPSEIPPSLHLPDLVPPADDLAPRPAAKPIDTGIGLSAPIPDLHVTRMEKLVTRMIHMLRQRDDALLRAGLSGMSSPWPIIVV